DKSVISTFSEEDGLPASGFNTASANLLPDGRIAIGRSHDLIVFDPEKIQPEQIPLPPVVITGFSAMNQWLPVDSLQKLPELRLKYNQNSVIIEFSTLSYLNQFAISYMMEGLDKTWTYSSGSRRAVYNYLPPGQYTFKVKSENGQESKVTTLVISIRTPFWKSWWFYSIIALLIAVLLYRDDRVRMRRKAALQKMRSDIAGNLHEEINTALNNINVLSEIARIKADKEPEQSKSYINEIRLKSHNMIIAMSDMLWSINPANDSMAKTINRIREFADALRNRHDIVINLQTDEKVARLKADMNIRHEVMIVYKLALRLLVEEMKAQETNIQLVYIRSQLQLNIFARHTQLPDSNNQAIRMIEEMKKRAASIAATLDLHSDEKGTAITLVVKA
ncbi:MAG: triple tyrosine motif-containing protein, partial [Chitinophagaceae bacterium]